MGEMETAYEKMLNDWTPEEVQDRLRAGRIRILCELAIEDGCYASVTHCETSDTVSFMWPHDPRPVRIPADQFLKFFGRSKPPRLRLVR